MAAPSVNACLLRRPAHNIADEADPFLPDRGFDRVRARLDQPGRRSGVDAGSDQSITNTQANCVDGSVLFASILRKISIKPFLVTIPGHMYVGFFLSLDKSDFVGLETTVIGERRMELMKRKATNLRR